MQALNLSRGIRAAFAVSALAVAAVASAGTDLTTYNISPTGTVQTTDWTNSISVAKFNRASSVLDSVDLSLDFSTEQQADITCLSPDGGWYDIESDLDLSLFDSNMNQIGDTIEFVREYSNDDIAFGATDTYGVKSHKFKGSINLTNPKLLDFLTGPDSLDFTVKAEGFAYKGFSGDFAANIYTRAGGNFSVGYNYSPQAVPEPASMAALGLGALGLLRRRKVSK